AAMDVEPPAGTKVLRVGTADEMLDAVKNEVIDADVLVMAAAVADYHAETVASQKQKKSEEGWTVHLARTPDILRTVHGPQIRVGFAAETADVLAHARQKLAEKDLDLIIANDVLFPNNAFGSPTNQVTVLDRDGGVDAWPMLPKRQVADRLLDLICTRLDPRSPEES
ncbi:bifunctional 4'-phosphopantothenoylcysteine decarboxylase/phosphopantothenoylcysteine synthetase, partial [Candidatus Bipolaricaulota bacterium]|nr:bifunctional 4'-phosphopantothenoylcysteine decarboxylase/phosphopantothenoylcysteine synthetase [Candidatus Bipolaricaulota bacterium]